MGLFNFAVNSMSHLFLMCFLFSYNKLRNSKLVSIVVLVLLWVAMVGIEWQRYLAEGEDMGLIGIASILIQVVLIQYVSIYISEYRDWRTIFSGLMSSNYVLLGNVVIDIVVYLTQRKWIGLLAGFLVHLIVFIVMRIWLHEAYMLVLDKLNIRWGAVCIIPVLFYFIFFTITSYPSSVWDTPTNLVPSALMAIVMSLFYLVAIQYMKGIYDHQKVMNKVTLLEAYTNGVNLQAESVKKAENEVRILRHDLKHLLNLISIMLEQKEYDRAMELLKQYVPPDVRGGHHTFCDNSMMNGILNTFVLRTKDLAIDARIRSNLPEHLEVDEMDVALVVSNLMENAINATQKLKNIDNRWIELVVRSVDGKLIIETKNPYKGNIDFDAETGIPKSKRGRNHGFGMQSIDAFVWKYHGMSDFFAEDNVFIARVIIPNIKSLQEDE